MVYTLVVMDMKEKAMPNTIQGFSTRLSCGL